jgi:hypothetical protein
MTSIAAVLISLTVAITFIVSLRIYCDWLRLNEAIEHGSHEDLDLIGIDLQSWQTRHLTGAGFAIFIMMGVKSFPNHVSDCLVNLDAVYAGLSLLFAATETALQQCLEAARQKIQ